MKNWKLKIKLYTINTIERIDKKCIGNISCNFWFYYIGGVTIYKYSCSSTYEDLLKLKKVITSVLSEQFDTIKYLKDESHAKNLIIEKLQKELEQYKSNVKFVPKRIRHQN